MAVEPKLKSEKKGIDPDGLIKNFTDSIKTDKRLFEAEIEVNFVFCDALFKAGILTRMESEKIKSTLQTIKKRASFDKTYFDNFPAGNIQKFVEDRLFQLIGDTGLKIKTGIGQVEKRSAVLRLWLRQKIERISKFQADLQRELIKKGKAQKEVVFPGLSNLKNEHPILFAHWVLAYFEMFTRDRERLDEVWRRVNILPLGTGKLAGVSFEIDFEEIGRDLGFEGITSNSLDAVSDFDFAVEFVNCCALIMIHLSRLSEDLLLYSSESFGFIHFGASEDQKTISDTNNTDVLRLVRARAGKVFGHQTALQANLKGLPMSYNRDFEEVLEGIFDSADCVENCLQVLSNIFSKIQLIPEKAQKAATRGFFSK